MAWEQLPGAPRCQGRTPAFPYLTARPGPGTQRAPPRQHTHVPGAQGACVSQHQETPEPVPAPAPRRQHNVPEGGKARRGRAAPSEGSGARVGSCSAVNPFPVRSRWWGTVSTMGDPQPRSWGDHPCSCPSAAAQTGCVPHPSPAHELEGTLAAGGSPHSPRSPQHHPSEPLTWLLAAQGTPAIAQPVPGCSPSPAGSVGGMRGGSAAAPAGAPAPRRTRRPFFSCCLQNAPLVPAVGSGEGSKCQGVGLGYRQTAPGPRGAAHSAPASRRTKAPFFSQHGQRPHLGGCSALSPRGPASAGRVVHGRAAPPQPGEPQHPHLPAAPLGRAAWGSAPDRPAAAH